MRRKTKVRTVNIMAMHEDVIDLRVGMRIYYGGDMANPCGFGEIAEIIPSERFTDMVAVQLDDGRRPVVPAIAIRDEYHGTGAIRFCTLEAYTRWRESLIDDWQRTYSQLMTQETRQ